MESPLNDVGEDLLKGVLAWKAENTPEKIAESVKETLDEHKRRILMLLAGFSDTWGKWELKSNGPMNGYIGEIGKKAIEEWFDGVEFTLSPAQRKLVEKSAQKAYAQRMSELSYDMGRKIAERDAKFLAETFCNTDSVDKLIQAVQLLKMDKL